MIVLVNGEPVVRTSTSKLTGITSKEEAIMFKDAYEALGFKDVEIKAEYTGPGTEA